VKAKAHKPIPLHHHLHLSNISAPCSLKRLARPNAEEPLLGLVKGFNGSGVCSRRD
jgi:hypothetical protein